MAKDTGLNPRNLQKTHFPFWEKPQPVGCFSVDTNRFYEKGHRNLRFFKYPNPELFPLDLNEGYETAKRKTGSPLDENIDNLLRFIMDNYKSIADSDKKRNPLFPNEFVCWRGLLRLIMCTPSETRQNWIINVSHYKGVFYLSQVETEEAKKELLKQTSMQQRMCSWGYKFEQYCLSKSPDTNPRTNVPVDECSEFSCVFKTKLEGHNLLFGAEMDGIRSDRHVHLNRELDLNGLMFVELKTSLKDMNNRQMHSYLCYKIRNWWCQSFLVGIETIIVGLRDYRGFVLDIEELPVSQLPKESKNWCPKRCAWFLIEFLNCIKSIMAKVDCPNTVFKFQYDAADSRITYEVFNGITQHSFLPDYYVEFIEDSMLKNKC